MRRSTRFLPALATLLILGGIAAAETDRERQSAVLRETLADAETAQADGDLDAAETSFRKALTLAESFGTRSLYVARAADGLAETLRRSGRPEAAIPHYLRAIALWQSLFGSRQPRLAVSLHNLGVAYLDADRPSAAVPVLEQALEIWTVAYGSTSDQAQNTERALDRCRRLLDDQRRVTGNS